MSGLIEGLPDSVVLRVPFHLHPMLELGLGELPFGVPNYSKSDKKLVPWRISCAYALMILRTCGNFMIPFKTSGLHFPFSHQGYGILHILVLSPQQGSCLYLADAVDPLTGDQDGSFATNEVWSYDPVARSGHRMHSCVRPAMFACCVLNGKVIVAGGFTSCRKSISQAELYDPDKDMWIPLPDLERTHNSPCSGILLDVKGHVVHKGLLRVQVWDHAARKWTVNYYSWYLGPMTMLRGSIYVMYHSNIFKQKRYSRRFFMSVSEFRKRIGFSMFGMGDQIYIGGGVIGPDRWNWCIKLLSNLDVIAVSSDPPTRRQVAPMTQCSGTILVALY